ncbi:LON peptidase N-terminal domain and RING finger protein 2 [Ambystoma mexicanum]|uniref:LON peptidase N-terminal domain and RING finger protein 2 n=1 Tax=Ambystoma mexicanum TaxID=8296 RepID=UPI0037E87473
MEAVGSSEMLQVAEEAVEAGDYGLAAEIYGSQLAELSRPERSLFLRRGEALARAGRVSEALDSYSSAAVLGRLRPEELLLLVESVAHSLREKGLPSAIVESELWENDLPPLLCCPCCKQLLLEPVTPTCGHSLCRACLHLQTDGQAVSRQCPICRPPGTLLDQSCTRVNVILGNLLQRTFPVQSQVRSLCLEALNLLQSNDVREALDKCNKAMELDPSDYHSQAQRAEVHTAMKSYKQALTDAEVVCQKKPLWPKGHAVKGQALSGLGRTDEALKEYLYCVALSPDMCDMKKEAQKIMCEMFVPAYENLRGSLTAPFCSPSYNRLKPVFLSSRSTSPSSEDYSNAGCSQETLFRLTKATPQASDLFQSPEPCTTPHHTCDLLPEERNKTLEAVLSNLQGATLKRPLSISSGDLHCWEMPNKIVKKDAESLPENTVTTSRLRESLLVRLDSSDFECSLCMRLFYEPVTTPCGHTFCLKCLERCLDHNPHCPLCKENLSEFLATRAYKRTLLTEELIVRYLPEELAERKRIHEEEIKELSNLTKDVPIFVCTMAFPTIPCPLHVFEPRYRLMIRRSMETGTKQFGMCISDELKGFADYGCMLEVRDVKFFPDGRSVVDTVGRSRFRVLSHGQRDGYNTANIEYLEDAKVEGPEYEELVSLHNSVYDQAFIWFTTLNDNMKSQILSHFGPMPQKETEPQSNPSGPPWCWWLLAVLPLESKAQLTILAMTSLKERLCAIRRVLLFVMRKRPR